MKLQYKVLWIDDQMEEYIDLGIKDEFESFLDSLGFIPMIKCFENGSVALESLQNEKYDLILSDYNIIGTEDKGDTLIQRIRDGGIFTEVLFYSAQADFDTIAKNLYRDRVSFFSLIGDESYRGFKEKVFNLTSLTISKLQELNNIRGLVMSETSELDNVVEEILHSFLLGKSKESEKLLEYICKIVESSAKDNFNIASKISAKGVNEIVKSRLFDADKKSRAINKLLEIIKAKGDGYDDFYTNYKKDVLDTRNDLAHAKSGIIDGVDYLIISRKGNEEAVKFDQENCIQIRKNLRRHSDILKNIRQLIVTN